MKQAQHRTSCSSCADTPELAPDLRRLERFAARLKRSAPTFTTDVAVKNRCGDCARLKAR
jgi:hypothetical protein